MTKNKGIAKKLAIAGLLGIAVYGVSKAFSRDGGTAITEGEDGSLELVITRRESFNDDVDYALPLSAEMTLTGTALKGVPAPDMLLEIFIESPKNLGGYKVIKFVSHFNVVLGASMYLVAKVSPTDIQNLGALGGTTSDSYGTQKFKGRMTLTNIFGTSLPIETNVVSATLGEPPSGSVSVGAVT